MSSFTEVEKMCLSQKILKKNNTKDNKGISINIFIFIYFFRRSKIFIAINDEWYEKKFGLYW